MSMSDHTKPRIIPCVETALGKVIESMTGAEYAVTAEAAAPDGPASDEAIVWQQAFSGVAGPSFWISAGRDLWAELGRATLGAAGIDEVTEEDCRSTWHEILNQTAGGMAATMTVAQGREVTASRGAEIDDEPGVPGWTAFAVTHNGENWSFKAAWTGELGTLCEPPREEAALAASKETPASRTFDLLLEVALPIAVSFGRTSMQIREVLKLNTGSIVELDRFVTDPVEVIVNDCVIARGEVVVVDGNYGVRINQLASREERFRTGIAEAARKGGRP